MLAQLTIFVSDRLSNRYTGLIVGVLQDRHLRELNT